MGGDDSQKLLPWRGISLLSGAQQTSGSLQNQYSTSKAFVPAVGNDIATDRMQIGWASKIEEPVFALRPSTPLRAACR